MSFQIKLREFRKKASLTQKQLGEAIGMSGQAVRLWELGLRKPSINKLKELSDFFGISTDILLDADDISSGLEVKDLKFRKSFEKLSPKGQQEVLSFLEYVRDKEEKLQVKEASKKKNS